MTDKDKESEYINHIPSYYSDTHNQYVFPNDSTEHVRLDPQARHLSAIMNGQFLHSPVDETKVRRILDVGCGTGIVTDYFGSNFQSADFMGLDLSPVRKLRDRPPDFRLVQGNVITQTLFQWTSFPSEAVALPDKEAFDLIFSRPFFCGMTAWLRFSKTEFSLLRPGGFAEVHDVDRIWYKHGKVVYDSWPGWQRLKAAAEFKGIDFACGSRTQTWMKETGFVDVRVHKY